MPGELLRHSGDGFAANGDPRGEVNADSIGASPTRIAAMPTIENRAVAQVTGRTDRRGRLVTAQRSMSSTESSSIGVYSRVMLTVIPRSTNRRPPESATATMSPLAAKIPRSMSIVGQVDRYSLGRKSSVKAE